MDEIKLYKKGNWEKDESRFRMMVSSGGGGRRWNREGLHEMILSCYDFNLLAGR